MDSKNRWQQVLGLTIGVLLLAGCVVTEPVSTTAVPPTDVPVSPTDTPVPPTDTPVPTVSVPIEQAIIGAWVNSEDDVHSRRYHIYTEDGKYCYGAVLSALLEEPPANCKAYKVKGNVLSEICTEETLGCKAGDVCKVEITILENGWLQYFVRDPCPSYPSGHPVVGDPNIFFKRVEEMTPTPDTSIVWSDDFDDGDSDRWEPGWRPGKYSVNDGVLSFTGWGGDVEHPSTVLYGTWSFDTYIGDNSGTTHEFRFTEGIYNYQMLEIKQSPNTQIWISTQQDPDHLISNYVDLGEKITSWHHFDITKDESGWIKVYLDGEFMVEHFDDIPFDAVSVVFYSCCEGPALDNVVVRNQIIDIQPSEYASETHR